MGRVLVKPADRKRLTPAERKEQILTEAYQQAEAVGLAKFTRVTVAEACGITDGLVSRYFGTLRGLQEAVVTIAEQREHHGILADALGEEIAINVGRRCRSAVEELAASR